MYEEQQKKTKLVSVINDLTSIKKQLHLLMSPISQERTTDSLLKSQNPPCRQASNNQLEAQRSDRFYHFHQPHQKVIKQSPRNKYNTNGLADQSKKCITRQSPQKDEKSPIAFQIKKQLTRKKDFLPLNKTSDNKESHQKFKFMPRDHRPKPIKNAFIDLVTRAEIEEKKVSKKQKQFSHFRHSSQRDLSTGNNYANINFATNSKIEKQFINQQKIQQKQFFLLKNNINITSKTSQNTKVKRLKRMKSDLVDHSQAFSQCIPQQVELQGNIQQLAELKEKVDMLQKQNAQKQGIIRILQVELKQIESAFIEMKLSIAKIIKIGTNSHKNIKQIQLNEALTQIIKDLELQKQEIKRLTIDSQVWRKLNFQQSLLIKANQQQLSKYRKINQTINELNEQNNRCKDQLLNISSKLQVSNNQNRIKDQFIIKFLIGKSLPSKESNKISQIICILQNYLKTCSYPNNKLMQKLNEEQNQIKKLRAIIDKDRKNSI